MRNRPLVFVTHYPLDASISNWFEVLDRLKRANTQAVLVGHGHANRALDIEGLPGVMGRSTLGAKGAAGAFTLVTVGNGRMTFAEHTHGETGSREWHAIAIDLRSGATVWRTGEFGGRESIGLSEDGARIYVRAMNDLIHAVAASPGRPEPVWTANAGFGYDINSAMLAEKDGVVFYGTKNGVVLALDAESGVMVWQHRFGVGLVNTIVPLGADRVLVADIDGRVGVIEAKTRR